MGTKSLRPKKPMRTAVDLAVAALDGKGNTGVPAIQAKATDGQKAQPVPSACLGGAVAGLNYSPKATTLSPRP